MPNISFLKTKTEMFDFFFLSCAFQMTGIINKSGCLHSISQVLLTLLILCCLQCHSRPHSYDSKPLSEISKEVSKYSDIAQQIINLAVYGKAQNRSYERLAEFTDTIGNRVSGSKNLDLAIKYMFNALTLGQTGECASRASKDPALGARGGERSDASTEKPHFSHTRAW